MNVSMHEQRILPEFALVGSIHSKRLENGKVEAVFVDKAVHALATVVKSKPRCAILGETARMPASL